MAALPSDIHPTDEPQPKKVILELEDGSKFAGTGFGFHGPTSGEVVFNTSMVGYVESLTDPSYRGQILVLTYPLIGNYGVPASDKDCFESSRIQASGLIVSTAHSDQSHATAARSLDHWLAEENVPGVEGIDTRKLTILLRERGTMLGRVLPADYSGEPVALFDPNSTDIVPEVCVRQPQLLRDLGHDPNSRTELGHVPRPSAKKRVILVDCGVKLSIRRELLRRGVEVLQVPADYDYTGERFDGILVSNGPGNPERCGSTVSVLHRALALNRPVFGICLGCQLIALAAGARTYKLRYGHRGQNQPCREKGTDRCRLTSQNHGYAVDVTTLPRDWQVWFENANDGSVEGIRHSRRPVSAVQFHPEGRPGPLDSEDLFDRFVETL
ncbi:glutamine-hydrolyzing carbamoyl-phosphate synthase small subunit [candidate division WOR-3 bacterium]|nr:glutamine-hydrolyzing carbamoyl-phosphate synthase small subunit [candidate division WOR-3 bacterium]